MTDKEQLIQLLKDNLTISVDFTPEWYDDGNLIKITIKFDGEDITSGSVSIGK